MNLYFDVLNILNTQNLPEYDDDDNYKNVDELEPVGNSLLFPAFDIEAGF